MRTPCHRHTPRRAFTLVEVLVVVSIVTVLTALITAAVFSTVVARRSANTDLVLRTASRLLQEHWSAVAAEARKEDITDATVFANLHALSGRTASLDTGWERAKAIWVKARLCEAFPMTYSEAKGNAGGAALVIPPTRRKHVETYKRILGTRTAAKDPASESSACLLMALSRERGGASVPIESITAYLADTDNDGMKELVDGWGVPLSFVRFAWNNEALKASNPAPAGSKAAKFPDLLDPYGALLNAAWHGAANPSAPPATLGLAFESAFHRTRDASGNPVYLVPVLASAGPDNILDLNFTSPTPDLSSTGPGSADNLYSFNLRLE